MPLNLRQTTAPTVEPVSLAEARTHLRVDDTTENDYITALIVAARLHAETYTDRQFITATWSWKLDCFPSAGWLRVPRPNLLSVSSLTYVDSNGDTQTLPTGEYQVDATSEPGRIMPAYGYAWPTTRLQFGAVTITYTAGYGATAATVPQAIRQAIMILVSQWFENREPVVTGTIVTPMPLSAMALLGPYRTGEVY